MTEEKRTPTEETAINDTARDMSSEQQDEGTNAGNGAITPEHGEDVPVGPGNPEMGDTPTDPIDMGNQEVEQHGPSDNGTTPASNPEEPAHNPIPDMMAEFVGTKKIKAYGMTKQQYCDYRGWDVPKDEDPKEAIYLVEYEKDPTSKQNHPDHEGYISMSPKHVFEKAYRHVGSGLTFGEAIEALKQGRRIARKGWNGVGLFIFMQVPSQIDQSIVPNMQSLPTTVKDEFARRFAAQDVTDGINYQNQIAMVYPDNSIYGWVASPSDVLEEDWTILD